MKKNKKIKKEGKKMNTTTETQTNQAPIFDDSGRSDFFKRRQKPAFEATQFTPEEEAQKIGKLFSKIAEVKSTEQGQ